MSIRSLPAVAPGRPHGIAGRSIPGRVPPLPSDFNDVACLAFVRRAGTRVGDHVMFVPWF